MRVLSRKPLGVLALLALASVAGATQDAEPVGAECRTCHEDKLASFDKTHHAGLTDGCTSCHVGAEEHLRGQMEGEDTPAPSFAALSAEDINGTCLGCHEKGQSANWMGSAHERRGVACTSCHSVHSFDTLKSQLKAGLTAFATSGSGATDSSETCYSCHPAIRAKTMRTSHHPIREGVMDCASCHNPHDGSRPKMLKAEWNNELCYECHTEKRGPFLWEHAPVREDCMNCHDPHGSNHDKLLVARNPYICQRCHLNTRHPGSLYDGSAVSVATDPFAASNRAVEHACKNCHQNVHGSNAPSGPYLGR